MWQNYLLNPYKGQQSIKKFRNRRIVQIEKTITINASADIIFRIYEDIANWHTWDPDTKKAVLDGPMRVGAKGRLTPTKGNTVPMQVTEFVHDQSFTVESRIPFFCMRFEHDLQAGQAGTLVIHRVTFSGLLKVVIGSMLKTQLDTGLPITLSKLKALAEIKAIESTLNKI